MRTLSVAGLGKLGKPLCAVLAKHYKVYGTDLKETSVKEPCLDELLKKHKRNILLGQCFTFLGKLTFIVVPTPSKKDDTFSSAYVESVLKRIEEKILSEHKKKHTVVIVSTLMPGETDRLQKKFYYLDIIYSPTFIALGSVIHDLTHPDFVLIGSHNKKGVNTLKEVYRKICRKPPVFFEMTPLEAEITKLSVNCYITMKITFANQIGNLCYRLGIKPDRILRAVGTDKRIGTRYLRSGLGYGGCCFPRDNKAMTAYFRDKKLCASLFLTTDHLNSKQPEEMLKRIFKLNPKSVGFKSLSFKEGTDNTECSQLLAIYERLKDAGYDARLGKGEINLDHWGIV